MSMYDVNGVEHTAESDMPTFDESRTLADIDRKLDYLLSEVASIKAVIVEVAPEVSPMIQRLSESTLFRMMTGGKK